MKEDGKEYMVRTTFSGSTIIGIKETEIKPFEYVDSFDGGYPFDCGDEEISS